MTSSRIETESFEAFVAELFRRLGRKDVRTNITFKGSLNHVREIDILFGTEGDATIVEVKGYRYRSPPQPDLFERALLNLLSLQRECGAQHLALVMSCPMIPILTSTANRYPNVEIWDARKLFEACGQFPDLLKQLEALLEVTVVDVVHEPITIDIAATPTAEFSKGRELAEELRAIRPGREEAYAFEDKCIDALKYLFEGDLFGWHEQHETDDGLHRRDLVCRILPNAEVWRLMLSDLRSRYVIFEFKNYSAPVSQYEIVTTERYLYPSALRRVAIIISPHGCSPSAVKVTQGAMREHGKLLISLTVEELASLLKAKDQGSDPNTFLFERVDEFLMALGR